MEAVIFGWGNYGRLLKKGLEEYYKITVTAICDNDESKWGDLDGIPIIGPQQLLPMSFDKIFVCIRKANMFLAVEEQLSDMGISKDKIVVMQRSIEYQDAYLALDPIRKNWIKQFASYTRELGLTGSVAECGVYYGETAMFINRYWAERPLYLCDTFEGFAQKDVINDAAHFEAFKKGMFHAHCFKSEMPERIVETIKARMLFPDKLRIYQGYFPESIGDIRDTFCFVNLDMDLYQPQLAGLRYFWDKMEAGGIILLHDYFHPELPGVREAVIDFEKERNRKLLKFPIGDDCSIAVIKDS